MQIEGLQVKRRVSEFGNGELLLDYLVRNERSKPVDVFVFYPHAQRPEWEFVSDGALKRVRVRLHGDELHLPEVHVSYDANKPPLLI